MGFLFIILHVLNGCPGETECMSEPVGVEAEHAVVMEVDCVVDYFFIFKPKDVQLPSFLNLI